jgi:hypothetical protein
LLAKRKHDPWERMPRVRQELTDAMLQQVGARIAPKRR